MSYVLFAFKGFTDVKEKPSEHQKAYQGMLTEAEVNYVPLSSSSTKACANCRWFLNNGCFIVSDWGKENPEPIIATGYCDRWESSPAPESTLADVLAEAIQNSSESISMAITSVLPTPPIDDMSKAVKSRVSLPQWIKIVKDKLLPDKNKDDSFTVFKGADGEYHWHAIYTNNFIDREGEILTKEGHDRFISRLDMGFVPMPMLDVWHIEGTEHGQADVIWSEEIPSTDIQKEMVFIHAVGHFDNGEMGKKAIKFYQNNEVKNSHAFITPDWAFDGTHYLDFNTIKISTLPPHAAANPYTSFEELKAMALTPEKEAYVEQIFGKEKLAQIIEADKNKAKSLDALKVTYKDFANTTNSIVAKSTDGDSNDDKVTPNEKALTAIYGELSEGQIEILNILNMSAKAYESLSKKLDSVQAEVKSVDGKHEAETSAWQKQLDEIRKQINLPIERGSGSSSTVVSKNNPELKDITPRENSLTQFLPGIVLKNPEAVTS